MFIVFGALGALDTVGSFCFGMNDYDGLNLYTIRMRIIITICFFLLTIPACLFSGDILKLMGINELVADKAQIYTKNMIPAIFFVFNFNLNVRFLQVMHDYIVVSVIAVVCVTFHYILNYVLFYLYTVEYYTVAYTSCISLALAFIMSTVYIEFVLPEEKRMLLYHPNIFKASEYWFFIKLSFFSALQHYGDFIGYEIIGFLGCYMKYQESNAASLVVLNYTVIT